VKNSKFDLEQRTEKFFLNVIDLRKKVPRNSLTRRQISQLIGSSGSIGANWREASECESRRDFSHKVKLSRKEAKESQLWLKGIGHTIKSLSGDCNKLIAEAKEFVYIFTSIINKVK